MEWSTLAWQYVNVSVRYRLSSGLWVEHMGHMGYFDLSISFELQYMVIICYNPYPSHLSIYTVVLHT